MKFLTYSDNGIKSLGCLINQSNVLNISHLSNGDIPNNLSDYLIDFELNNVLLNQIINSNFIDTINLNKLKIKSL